MWTIKIIRRNIYLWRYFYDHNWATDKSFAIFWWKRYGYRFIITVDRKIQENKSMDIIVQEKWPLPIQIIRINLSKGLSLINGTIIPIQSRKLLLINKQWNKIEMNKTIYSYFCDKNEYHYVIVCFLILFIKRSGCKCIHTFIFVNIYALYDFIIQYDNNNIFNNLRDCNHFNNCNICNPVDILFVEFVVGENTKEVIEYGTKFGNGDIWNNYHKYFDWSSDHNREIFRIGWLLDVDRYYNHEDINKTFDKNSGKYLTKHVSNDTNTKNNFYLKHKSSICDALFDGKFGAFGLEQIAIHYEEIDSENNNNYNIITINTTHHHYGNNNSFIAKYDEYK